MSGTTEKAKKVTKDLMQYHEAAPETINAFRAMHQSVCNDQGILNFKTKELIAVAVSIARMCKPCILSHLGAAIKAGTTREELIEAANVAIVLCGGPGYVYAAYALECFDDLIKGE